MTRGTGISYAERRVLRKKKEERNKKLSINILSTNNVEFVSHDGGHHIVINGVNGIRDEKIDFWPTTEKFKCRVTGEIGHGIFPLLEFIGIEDCDHTDHGFTS